MTPQQASTSTAPLVSIVLTTFNGQQYLPAQLDSLLAQTYPNIEIIAVDDRSTDDTVAILRSYAAKHANMQVIVNEENLGYKRNFDKACGLASGKWIALCDHDDAWDKEKIEKLVNIIGNSPMAYCDSYICTAQLQQTGKRISDNVNSQPWTNCLQQAVFCRIYGNTMLLTKELYNAAHPFLLAIPHDWWLAFVATLHGRIEYLHEPLVYYRQHAQNLIGAVGGKKSDKRKESLQKEAEVENIRTRIKAFYEICPAHLEEEKKILSELSKSYQSFSITNNFHRMNLFLQYKDELLKVKKHSALHRYLFSLKMFFKIK
ncbi:glycosyltransferase family 2 protein [Aridibaculum aurantiacum]|uniref:glycosyltransferase family 2 protein n=1 Tax=Aridibaculum aurantiacum TaxID=2810307 RepID=UPI001A963952|nr:glycosyltransferase family 2 protein [Aridibaculum aurantiacum]